MRIRGTLGGHRTTRIYGRLDCPSALRAIANGGYVANRVFFADEAAAVAAGYRPCARCLPERYRDWKAASAQNDHVVVPRGDLTVRTGGLTLDGLDSDPFPFAASRFSEPTTSSALGNSW